jgi:hypothetical protein
MSASFQDDVGRGRKLFGLFQAAAAERRHDGTDLEGCDDLWQLWIQSQIGIRSESRAMALTECRDFGP